MTLGQTDKDIILGRAQNQAIELIKTEMLVLREEDATKAFDEKNYTELCEKLFKLNCDQHERLCRQPQKPQQPVKKEEPKTQEPKKPTDKQKACEKCTVPIPKSWMFHKDCGWNVKQDGDKDATR